jgi:RNA polymerase-binding transcription factor
MDAFDRAQELELKEREQALAAQQKKTVEPPMEINGIRYCLDCGGEVLQARIAALPTVVRCVDCQSLNEQRSR